MAANTTKKTPAPKASGAKSAKSAKSAAPTAETAAEPRIAKAKVAKAAPTPAMPADPPRLAPAIDVTPEAPTRDAIAQRAYEIWRAEGGHALDNWLRAERELRA